MHKMPLYCFELYIEHGTMPARGQKNKYILVLETQAGTWPAPADAGLVQLHTTPSEHWAKYEITFQTLNITNRLECQTPTATHHPYTRATYRDSSTDTDSLVTLLHALLFPFKQLVTILAGVSSAALKTCPTGAIEAVHTASVVERLEETTASHTMRGKLSQSLGQGWNMAA